MEHSPHRIFLSDTVNADPKLSAGGVARYFRRVADGIIDHFGSEVVMCSSQRRHYGPAKYIYSPCFRGNWRAGFHDKVASIASCLVQPSVFFSPYYGNARTNAAQVFTVHDMIHELFPRYFSREITWNRRFIEEKKNCLERASVLIAVSQNTAKDIVRCYPCVDPAKIVVIYHGVDDYFFQGQLVKTNGEEKPFFLYVGLRSPYKGFTRLLEAFGRSGLSRDFDLRVISSRGNGFSPQEATCISGYHLENNVRLTAAANESDLCTNYRHAAALVYPSEYEGFGLPILEAMASGTLVATSSISSMPEVGGDVALFFDPYETESIANCLIRVAHLSSEERREHIQRGIARARTFTWERCEQQTVDVLQKLAVGRL